MVLRLHKYSTKRANTVALSISIHDIPKALKGNNNISLTGFLLGSGTMRTIRQISCADRWTGTSKRYRLARENNSKLERLHLHQPQFGARSSVTARIRNQPVV